MAGKVIQKDRGYKRIWRAIRAAKRNSYVAVGIPQSEEKYKDSPYTVAEIAAVHEFGSSDGHIPERSYIRSTLDENRGAYLTSLAETAKTAVDKGLPATKTALGRLGARVSADIKRKITAFDSPPNAPSTIAKKGSDNPLIDTGTLRRAITWRVEVS